MGLQAPSVSSSKVIVIKTVRLFLLFSRSCEGEIPGKVMSKEKWEKSWICRKKLSKKVLRMLTKSCISKYLWGTKPYTFWGRFHFHLFGSPIINSALDSQIRLLQLSTFCPTRTDDQVIKKDFFLLHLEQVPQYFFASIFPSANVYFPQQNWLLIYFCLLLNTVPKDKALFSAGIGGADISCPGTKRPSTIFSEGFSFHCFFLCKAEFSSAL